MSQRVARLHRAGLKATGPRMVVLAALEAVCRLCGAIFDVDRDQLQLPSPPGHLSNGLMVTGIRFEYEVICRACQEAAGKVGQKDGQVGARPVLYGHG